MYPKRTFYTIVNRLRFLLCLLMLGGVLVFPSGCDSSDPGTEQVNQLRPPQDVEVTATPGRRRVSISWSLVEVAVSYSVYRSTTPSEATSGAPIAEEIEGTSFVDTSVAFDSTYYYRITATGTRGTESSPSEEVEVTVIDSPPDN